jgi:putative lipoic acid-binding regulatory protein
MNSAEETDAFYKKLKSQLQDTNLWPAEYLYKFIVKTDVKKIDKLEQLFNNLGAVIKTTESKNAKYTSVSINVRMKSPDAVINKYKEVAEKIDNVISL